MIEIMNKILIALSLIILPGLATAAIVRNRNTSTDPIDNGTSPPDPIDPIITDPVVITSADKLDAWKRAFTIITGSNTIANRRTIDGLYDNWQVYGDGDDRKFAYIMASAYAETLMGFYKYENQARSFFDRYEPPSAIARELGNTVLGDGYKYRGRGDIQITGKANYQKFKNITGRDIINDPDQVAEDKSLSTFIAVYGMVNGTFTGVRLSDYFTSSRSDYFNARKIVNRLDRAQEIADNAQGILSVYNSSLIIT